MKAFRIIDRVCTGIIAAVLVLVLLIGFLHLFNIDYATYHENSKLIDFMLQHTILINRPIVVTPLGTKLCRPSEVVLDILPDTQKAAFAAFSYLRRQVVPCGLSSRTMPAAFSSSRIRSASAKLRAFLAAARSSIICVMATSSSPPAPAPPPQAAPRPPAPRSG